MKKKNKPKGTYTPIRPSIEHSQANDYLTKANNSKNDKTTIIEDSPFGRITTESMRNPNGSKTIITTSVPHKRLKKNNLEDIKHERESGVPVRQIATKYDISISYVYQLTKK